MSPGHELFGESRLRETLQTWHDGDLPGMRRALLARVDAHRAGAPLSDDLTLLLRRVEDGDNGSPYGAALAEPSSNA